MTLCPVSDPTMIIPRAARATYRAGRLARLAAKINQVKIDRLLSGALVLLVDSGDYNMGTAYDMLWNTDPAPFRFINTMGYDLITLGNHEFDYGPKKLALMINRARASAGGFSIPIIATNTVFDGISGTDDDNLEELKGSVIINDYYVRNLLKRPEGGCDRPHGQDS